MRRRRRLVLTLLALSSGALVACATADLGEEEGVALPDRADSGDGSSTADRAMPADPDVFQPGVDAGLEAEAAAPQLPRVFATSTTQNANFGGLAGGDLICTNLAKTAGLGGKWAAWLSVQGGPHAGVRVTSVGPWSLIGGGEVVATTKTQLLSGALAHPINRDEKGTVVTQSRVWTGSNSAGTYETNDCDKWTNGANGRVGDSSMMNGAWTSVGVDGCNQVRRLYCFEL